ncbi:hypothetical protein [Pedobacter sp. NJ-S-72]
MLPEGIDELKEESPASFKDDVSVDRHKVHLKVIEIASRFFEKTLGTASKTKIPSPN